MSSSDAPNSLGPAVPLAFAATELGGRARAAGDGPGAYRLYACAVRLVRKVRGLSEVADFRLERAFDESESQSDPSDGAEILHDAFDSLLPEIEPLSVPDDPLAAAQQFIQLAISIGAPAYNLDDRQGCFDVYSCTARMILATKTGTDAAQKRLSEALAECESLDDANRQAWAMRHGFDEVLDMSNASGTVAPAQVREFMRMAISIGAPAFDLGDTRGCYEVYACTARLLFHSVAVPKGMKDRLGAALTEAATLPDPSRQAWILRQAFDAILGGTSEDASDEAAD